MDITKCEYRAGSWAAEGNNHITGYAIVFNSRTVMRQDPATGLDYGEMIAPTALDGAAMGDVLLRYNHAGSVLARTKNGSLTLTVDQHGLKISANLDGSEEARQRYEEIRNGLLDKMSFAFIVAPGGDRFDTNTRTRIIEKIELLRDVSIVDIPAYNATTVEARSRFEEYAAPDVKAHKLAELRNRIPDAEPADYAGNELAAHSFTAELRQLIADYDPKSHKMRNGGDYFFKQLRELSCGDREGYIAAIECRKADADPDALAEEISLLAEARALAKADRDYLITMVNQHGKIIPTNFEERKDKPLDMETEIRKVYENLVEQRAAASSSDAAAVIPSGVFGRYVREGANGLYPRCSVTNIHNTNVKVPYIGQQTVNTHTENAAITPGNAVPSTVAITSAEYECSQGYSLLAKSLMADEIAPMIEESVLTSLNKKLDALAVAAVDGLTWSAANKVTWTTSGAPTLAEILSLMKLADANYTDGAVFVMNTKTKLAVIESAHGTTGMYNVDVTGGLDHLFGVEIVVSQNAADGTIYYGVPGAVHGNFSHDVDLAMWDERSTMTTWIQGVMACGFGCEVGSWVKGSNS